MMEDGKLREQPLGITPHRAHGTGRGRRDHTGVQSLPWAPLEELQLAPGRGTPTGTPSSWGQMAGGPDSPLSKSRRTPWLPGGHSEVQGPGNRLGSHVG